MMKMVENQESKKPIRALDYFQTYTYKSFNNPELDVNEYLCPVKDGCESYPYVTTGYCRALGMGTGCRDIQTCEAYKKQKLLEEQHPELDWEDPSKMPTEKISFINMKKKGIIIEPTIQK